MSVRPSSTSGGTTDFSVDSSTPALKEAWRRWKTIRSNAPTSADSAGTGIPIDASSATAQTVSKSVVFPPEFAPVRTLTRSPVGGASTLATPASSASEWVPTAYDTGCTSPAINGFRAFRTAIPSSTRVGRTRS